MRQRTALLAFCILAGALLVVATHGRDSLVLGAGGGHAADGDALIGIFAKFSRPRRLVIAWFRHCEGVVSLNINVVARILERHAIICNLYF